MKSASVSSSLRIARLSIAAVLLGSAGHLSAAVFLGSWNSGFTSNGAVPDGNAAGWSDTRTVTIPGGEIIVDVNVHLSLSGGWNGDLYAYLTNSGSPNVAILLNRPGRTAGDSFGYGDSALTVTFDDGGAHGDIHAYQTVPGYAVAITNNSGWQPDGRTASPLLVNGSEPRTAMLSGFNGLSGTADTWTLFVADLSTGDVSTVSDWGLNIRTIPIPEPGAAVMLLLAGAMMMRRRRS